MEQIPREISFPGQEGPFKKFKRDGEKGWGWCGEVSDPVISYVELAVENAVGVHSISCAFIWLPEPWCCSLALMLPQG